MKTKQPAFLSRLEKLGACEEAREWAAGFKSGKTAWAACERGDWMLWLAGRLSGLPESDGRKKLVLCCCECARLSLPIYEARYPNDGRVRKCLDTAERWARGEATIEELREARAAAYAAYAADAADAYAAYLAADAAAAYAAAAYAAYSYAANAANAANASTLKQCADIVRKHYPMPPGLRNKA
jgi:hypothetical protein